MNREESAAAHASREDAVTYIEQCGEYAHASERDRLIENWANKGLAAAQIIRDVTRRAADPRGRRVLDFGFGNGEFSLAFAKAGAYVSGLEVNPVLLDIAQKYLARAECTADLRTYDGNHFPFADESFDLVFSTSVLEHVDDPEQVLKEVARVLAPGGKLYIAFPNRAAIRETHTGVLFLSYLPRAIAARLLKTFYGRNTIEELNVHFIGFFALRRYLKAAGLSLVFETDASTAPRRLLKRALALCGIHFSAILKTIMIIAEKPVSRASRRP